jgi:hypothetical protein
MSAARRVPDPQLPAQGIPLARRPPVAGPSLEAQFNASGAAPGIRPTNASKPRLKPLSPILPTDGEHQATSGDLAPGARICPYWAPRGCARDWQQIKI